MNDTLIFLALWIIYFILDLSGVTPRTRSAIMLILLIAAFIYAYMSK